MRRNNYLVPALFLFALALWLALVGFEGVVQGQQRKKAVAPPPTHKTQPEPRATHTCTVAEQREGITIVDCDSFTMKIPSPVPAIWKNKKPGSYVFVHREGSQALPVSNAPPTCRERIRQAFFSKCPGGQCARMDIDNERLTPADCLPIPAAERIGYTKEDPPDVRR